MSQKRLIKKTTHLLQSAKRLDWKRRRMQLPGCSFAVWEKHWGPQPRMLNSVKKRFRTDLEWTDPSKLLVCRIGRTRLNVRKWGYIDPAADVVCPMCDLPESPTMPYFLECSSRHAMTHCQKTNEPRTALGSLRATCDEKKCHEIKTWFKGSQTFSTSSALSIETRA